MTAFVANTNILELLGLKSAIEDDAFINDAVVTVTVKDASGAAIAGATWPVTMDYVTASNGDYRAVLVDGLALTPRQPHYAVIEVDAGINRKGHWDFLFTPQTRTK